MRDIVADGCHTEEAASLEVFLRFLYMVRDRTGLDRWTLFCKRHDEYCAETDTWTTGRYGAQRWTEHTTDELAALSEEIYLRNHASEYPCEYFIGIPRGAAVPPLWCLDLDADHGCRPEEELARMCKDGFTPLAVVHTSPQNRQAWLTIAGYSAEELSLDNYSEWRSVHSTLISRYSGDTGSKGPSHVFRLPFPGLRNLKTIASEGLVRYKYDRGFRSSVRLCEPVSPGRPEIESWKARDTGSDHSVAQHQPDQRTDCRHKRLASIDSDIPESVWKSWTTKRVRLIREGRYLRPDGSPDDSRVDMALMYRTIHWYLRNNKGEDAMHRAMTHLVRCCIRQVETDPERVYKKGNIEDYAERTLGQVYTYVLRELNDRSDLAAAGRLSEAYHAL